MNVGQILRGKTKGAASIVETATVRDAVDELAQRRIGLLLVTDNDGVFCGVTSERDVMRALSEKGGDCLSNRVGDLMTRDVITCRPAEDSHDALVLMGQNTIRHLPVVDGGDPVGVISATDILRSLSETGSAEERAALWTKVAWV